METTVKVSVLKVEDFGRRVEVEVNNNGCCWQIQGVIMNGPPRVELDQVEMLVLGATILPLKSKLIAGDAAAISAHPSNLVPLLCGLIASDCGRNLNDGYQYVKQNFPDLAVWG